MKIATILGAYLFVDLFVALPCAYVLLAEKHAEGEKTHPVATVIMCSLWPLLFFLVGLISIVLYFAAPAEFDRFWRRERRGAK